MLFDSNSKYSIPMEIHPRMAWIYCRSREIVEGGVGPVAGVSAAWMPRPSPGGHFRDGFTASPATGSTPPTHRKPAFDVASALAVASAGAGRSPADNPPPATVRRTGNPGPRSTLAG
ncbi:hypothetical protein C6Y55_18440 [Stenotrophomonas maltophilia]|nr:hypothetical protein C6Y55_18440 [Stenotrophomonas maltophilia]